MATVNEKMTAIADAIRDKTNSSEALTLNDMVTQIPKVYEAGKKDFWNTYLTEMRAGRDSMYLFSGQGWNSTTFYPTENIVPKGNCTGLFAYFSWFVAPYINLVERLEQCKVSLDTQYCTNFSNMFANCFTTRLPKITILNATGLTSTFSGMGVLKILDELQLRGKEEIKAGMAYNIFDRTFKGCGALEELTIVGLIGNNIDFSPCTKLKKESILGTNIKNINKDIPTTNRIELNNETYYGGIFGALARTDMDIAGKTLTLSITAVNKAFETSQNAKDGSTSQEWLDLVALFPNWTISLA